MKPAPRPRQPQAEDLAEELALCRAGLRAHLLDVAKWFLLMCIGLAGVWVLRGQGRWGRESPWLAGAGFLLILKDSAHALRAYSRLRALQEKAR